MNEQQEQPSSVPDEQETVQTVEEETFEKPNEEESNEEESKEEESKEQALQEETPSQTSVAKQDNMEATLPERYKKKVRTGMQGFGVKGPNYRSIYKAFLQATNHVQFRRYICESFPKDGDKIYAKIQNIFGEYRKECK